MTIFLATWETEIGGSRFKASLGKKLVRPPHLNKKARSGGIHLQSQLCERHRSVDRGLWQAQAKST
jgi:hypothetical protein